MLRVNSAHNYVTRCPHRVLKQNKNNKNCSFNRRDARFDPTRIRVGSRVPGEALAYLTRCAAKQGDVGQKMYYFLATGNLVSPTGLDLQQTSGYTIVAEKLNYLRYLSHFRSVHRGSFFTEMKTTAVRKLLPNSWGFLCPVHTPDGSPCGLLSHLTRAVSFFLLFQR